MVTVAPAITAPDGSFTVPEIVPDPPELAHKTPQVRGMPRDRTRIKKAARLSNMNFLHVNYEIFVFCDDIFGRGILRRGEDRAIAGMPQSRPSGPRNPPSSASWPGDLAGEEVSGRKAEPLHFGQSGTTGK